MAGVITVTVADEEGRTAVLQVSADATVGTLKELVAAEMGVPAAQQVRIRTFVQKIATGLGESGMAGCVRPLSSLV